MIASTPLAHTRPATALLSALSAVALIAVQGAAPSWAQQPYQFPPAQAQAQPPAQPKPKPPKAPAAAGAPGAPAAAAAAPKAPKAEAGPSATETALRQRIDNLEEQLVDMQVVVGTLESLAKSGGAASASPAYRGGAASSEGGTSDQGRVAGLEAQVKSLTAQVQQLSEQVRAAGSQPRRADATGTASPASSGSSNAPAPTGFGTATVSTARGDPIEGIIGSGGSAAPSTAPSASGGLPPIQAALPAGGADGGNPKQAYETAYGYLLQQDYGAAEVAFDDFLKRYPNDNLAGNAQFWLGESYFVRGQFKAAAAAFLKGYQSYGRSAKAPDSLLKLAMSLGRLGQKDAACSSFNELNTRFPAASSDVKSRAATEKQRTGCT